MRSALAACLSIALAHFAVLVDVVLVDSVARADPCNDCIDYGTDPVEPILGTLDITDNPADIELRGNRAYLITNDTYSPQDPRVHELVIADVTDPAAPMKIGSVTSPWGHFALDVEGTNAYASRPSLAKFDVSDPANPVQTGYFDFAQFPGETAGALDASGSLAYVLADANGVGDRLRIFDVSGDDPVPVGVVEFPTWMNDLVVRDSHVYVVGGGGLWVVDATDPASPAILEQILLSNQAIDVEATGTILVVSVFERPSAIFDVTEPDAPVLLTEGPGLGSFELSGDHLYAPYGSGLRVFDLSDPSDPRVIGTASGVYAFFLDVDGCRVATVNPFIGDELRMVPVQCGAPTSSVAIPGLDVTRGRIRSVPNPARAGRTIELILPSRGSIEIGTADDGVPVGAGVRGNGALAAVRAIGIHDASGRLVRSLGIPAARSTVSWDGLDHLGRRLGAGVYFLRAPSQSGPLVGKITVYE